MTGNEGLFLASELWIVRTGFKFHFKVFLVRRLMKSSLKYFSHKTDADFGVQSFLFTKKSHFLSSSIAVFERKVATGGGDW